MTIRVRFVYSIVVSVASLFLLASAVQAQTICPAPSSSDVTTWHDDNCRTGWQQYETVLNANPRRSTPLTQRRCNSFTLAAE